MEGKVQERRGEGEACEERHINSYSFHLCCSSERSLLGGASENGETIGNSADSSSEIVSERRQGTKRQDTGKTQATHIGPDSELRCD